MSFVYETRTLVFFVRNFVLTFPLYANIIILSYFNNKIGSKKNQSNIIL